MKNKKLIASLTLAGFMATSFVPAAGLGLNAAYAAAADVSVSASYLETADVNPEVDVNETVEVKLGLLNRDNQAVADFAPNFVVVWAESTSGRADDAMALVTGSAEKATAEQGGNGMIKLTPSEAAEAKLQVKFARAGSYTLHAAYVAEDDYNKLVELGAKTSDFRAKELTTTSDKKTIKVAAKTSVDGISIDNGTNKVGVDGTTAVATTVKDNGIESKEVNVVVYRDKDRNVTVGRGVKVTFETNSNNIQLDKKEATTGNGGNVTFKVSGTNEGDYKVYVRAEGKEFTVPVAVSNENRVDNLVNTKLPSAPISVNDAKASQTFADDIRFEFKDRNGNTVKTVNDQPALKNSDAGYVKVVEKPAKSKVEGKDFKLVKVKDKDYYTVATNKDLVEGKYVVRFALENGKYAEASFEVAEFGKAVALKVEYNTETVELEQDVKAPDIYFVDEKGVKKKATDVNIGFSGYAVESFKYTDTERGSFKVKNDEKYLGSKITVTAVADRQNLVAVAELSVAQDGRGLKFAQNSGVVNVNNTVDFKIVDGAGKSVSIAEVSNVNGVNAVVLSSSNKDAVVSTNITSGDIDAVKGEGTLRVTSTKPTTAEIQVFVRDKNNKYYAGTLTYTFGETAQNSTVNRFVVMSINNDMANVNNVNVKLDAAPIVKMNRTFVPFRAVAEAFGAEVSYDEATKKVTTKLDGKTLELTLGSKKLVVNGQEKAMDVEPFAQNSRTMVPVRFVAEELGFKVSAVRDAKKGGTAAVVFSR